MCSQQTKMFPMEWIRPCMRFDTWNYLRTIEQEERNKLFSVINLASSLCPRCQSWSLWAKVAYPPHYNNGKSLRHEKENFAHLKLVAEISYSSHNPMLGSAGISHPPPLFGRSSFRGGHCSPPSTYPDSPIDSATWGVTRKRATALHNRSFTNAMLNKSWGR